MRVTVCQMDPRPQYLDSFLTALAAHVREQDSDFVVLPEMCFADWLAAEPHVDEDRWSEAVAAHALWITDLGRLGAKAVVGTRPIVTAQGSRRNEAYLWTAATQVAAGVHQKYYLPDEEGYWENTWYDRGPKSFEVARALGMRLGVQICTEMWYFEWARHYAAARADLLCIPRATPHSSVQKWLAGGQAAAACAGAYCLSSNLWVPPGDGPDLGGLGWAVDPEGNILATTNAERPFVTVTVDLAFARRSKFTYPRYVPE